MSFVFTSNPCPIEKNPLSLPHIHNQNIIILQTYKFHRGLLAIATAAAVLIASADTRPDTWVGMDEQGRIVPTSDNLDGGRKTLDPKVEIGMFYYIWHGTEGCMKPTYNITSILDAPTTSPAWGPERHYHWWGKPWLGYYDAGNQAVIYKHLQMLCDAGVDFIVFDCTNGLTYCDRIQTFINVLRQRQKQGMRTPKLTCMTHANQTVAITDLWNNLYSKPEYADVWYRWQGNPLLLCDAAAARADAKLAHIIPNLNLRHSWAWTGGKENTWSWLDHYPQGVGYTMTDGKKVPECISVGSAQHPTTNIGKSYTSTAKQPAVNAKGVCDKTPEGLYYAEQWKRAKSLSDTNRPPVVLLTQWNEFIAMRFRTGDKTGADPGKVRPGGKKGDQNESYFVDVYTAEYNRDLEPSTHPLIRDNYYMQTVEEIRKYRGVNPIPLPTNNVSISIDGPWSQWKKETLEFTDDKADHNHVAVAQNGGDRTIGNDIVACKVTKDNDNLYFFVETAANIAWDTTSRRMRLLLNTDCDYTTGWEGYDFIVERNKSTKKYELKKSTSDEKFQYTTVSQVEARWEKKQLMLAVKKADIERQGNFDIDFKWIDNCNIDTSEPMLMYSDGDCAPNHRFNYRFKGSATTMPPIPGMESSGMIEVFLLEDAPKGIKAWPNPTTGLLNIESDGTIGRIDIYSTSGALAATFPNPSSTIDVTSLPSGHYIMSVDNTSSLRLIKR